MRQQQLTKTQQQIYDLVRRRPRTAKELHATVWWLHPQDAPDVSVIKAHVWHANRRLAGRGERIVGEWGGDRRKDPVEALYRLEIGGAA